MTFVLQAARLQAAQAVHLQAAQAARLQAAQAAHLQAAQAAVLADVILVLVVRIKLVFSLWSRRKNVVTLTMRQHAIAQAVHPQAVQAAHLQAAQAAHLQAAVLL